MTQGAINIFVVGISFLKQVLLAVECGQDAGEFEVEGGGGPVLEGRELSFDVEEGLGVFGQFGEGAGVDLEELGVLG